MRGNEPIVMYAQYQQYQNQNNQYQQQTTSSSSQPQWNGTSWVYPNNPQQPSKQQIIPPNPVETFTQYYHAWTKREEHLRQQLTTIGPNERQNIESDRQWAKYYAEESSRAAHHFHQNPQATSAPFDLPPAPPTAGSENNNHHGNSSNNTANHQNKQKSYASAASGTRQANNSSSSSNPSGSITRYVKRNIERPEVKNDPKLRSYVQSEIEKEIAAAIQKGALQSKNWDLVPLIVLPQDKKPVPPPPPPPPPQYQQHQTHGGGDYQQQQQTYGGASQFQNHSNYGSNSNSGNYYGPAASNSASTTQSTNYGGDQLQNSGSYYGPSHNNTHNFQQPNGSSQNNLFPSSSIHLGNKKAKKRKHQQQQEEDFIPIGHYGPSSSPTHKKSKKYIRKHNKLVIQQDDMNGMDHSQQTMSKRASRFSGRGGIHEASAANSRSSLGIYGHDKYMGKGTIGGTKTILDETDFEQMTVKGTCNVLEKDYLRLTAPPRAEFVRPFGILQQHLRNLQNEYYCCHDAAILQNRMTTPQSEWNMGEDKSRRQHDYLWFCSQLKAIRQDCTVQRIQCELAVDVYETHARIALQEGDLNE